MKKIALLFFLFSLQKVFAQSAGNDSLRKLPFAISNEKKLPPDELADKREGAYVTGIPDISYDPLNGLGYGGEGSLFFNGKRRGLYFNFMQTTFF